MAGLFDDVLTPDDASGGGLFDDILSAKEPEGGFMASVKQTAGSVIKGAGQAAADFIPGVGQDNAVKRYGQEVIDANPTAVRSLGDIADKPGTAIAEATGNAGASIGGMLGARALGMGITAAAPLTGPLAPATALVGQAVAWLGPAAIAALPSFGGIRDKQMLNDPANQDDWKAKASATLGAAAVGAIESKFGPQNWAMAAMTKEGRAALAEKFAETTLARGVGFGALKGAAVEGAEELVQNPIEQVAAFDNPTTRENLQDTAFSGAMGALGGGVFGGAAGGLAPRTKAPQPAQDPPAPTLGLPYNPDPYVSFPDGTVGRRADVENYIASLPENQRLAARAKLAGLAPQKADLAEAILSAPDADAAIRNFVDGVQTSIAGTGADSLLAPANDFLGAVRGREADVAADAADLADFRASEERNPQVARAQAQKEQQRQAELDALQASGTGQYGIPIEAKPAVEQAAALEAPTAMQLAMQKAREKAETPPPRPSEMLASDVAPAAPAAPAPSVPPNTSASAAPARSPDILPTDIARKDGTPFQTASGARYNQRFAGGVDASDVVPVQGGFVVRPKPQPSTPDATTQPQAATTSATPDAGAAALPAAPEVQPAAGGVDLAAGNAQPGDGALKPVNPKLIPVSKRVPQAQALAGEKIDKEWTAFAPESGTKGVPRADMPQIKAEHRGAMTQFLGARGITHETVELPASDLKPTQAEFSPAKVAKAKAYEGGERSILVSSDGHILDGHHQWAAALEDGKPVKAIRLDAPIDRLLAEVKEFPSAQQADGATEAAQPPETEKPVSGVDVGNPMSNGNQPLAPATADGATPPKDPRLVPVSKRPKGGSNPRTAARDRNPLLTFLATHGLFHDKSQPGSQKAEFSPDRQIMVMGYGPVFRKTGMRPDMLLERAVEEGYLPPDASESDLSELIRRAIAGERIAPLYAEGVAESEAERRIQAQSDLAADMQEADNAPLLPYDDDEAVAGVSELPDAALFAVDDNIPFEAQSNIGTAAAMRLMGFSEQEISDAIAEESRGAQEDRQDGGQADEAQAGTSAGDRARRDGEARPDAEQDLLGQAPNASQQAAERERQQRAAADRARQQQAPSADGFTLGMVDARNGREVDPGQGGLFDAAPTAETPDPKTTAIAAIKAADMPVADKVRLASDIERGNVTPAAVAQMLEQQEPAPVEPPAAAPEPAAKPVPKRKGIPRKRLDAFVESIGEDGPKDVRIADTVADLPESGQRRIQSEGMQGVRGMYDRGTDTVWLVRENLGSEREAQFVLLHEAFHRGLAPVLGDGVKPVLNRIYLTNKSVREQADRLAKELKIGRMEAIEEVLADMAGEGKARDLSGWDRLVALIRQFVEKLGFDLTFTDDMVEDLVAAVRREGLKGGVHINTPTSQTDTPAFRKWFGDSRVVDAAGKPLRVYHGTTADFAEFKTGRRGAFFASSPEGASAYAGTEAGSQVMPAYLSISNPYIGHVGRKGPEIGDVIAAAKRGGHDGAVVTYDDFPGERAYVAFRPEQIKSAIGNRGTFDPENPDIRYSRSSIVGATSRQHTPEQLRAMKNVGFQVEVPTLEERARALWKDAGKKLAQGIVDQFAPVKALDGTAYGLLRLAKGASGAFEAFLHGGKLKLSDNVYDFDETERGGVVEKLLMPLQGEHHDFMRWIAANRAERLKGEDKERLFSDQDIADLKTLASGTTAFDYTVQTGPAAGRVTRDRTLIYADSLRIFNQFNKNILDMAEQSGLIDGASRKLWENEFYVPFYRVADDSDGGIRGANIKGGVVRQQAFKALKGGKNALNADLLDNTLMNWAHLLDAAAKNRAAKATIEAAERMGVAAPGNQSTLAQMAASINNKNGVVWFMDGGQKRYSLIDDPYIMTALTSLEYAGMRNPVMNAMGAFKHALTVGVTASPFFKIRNLIRDSVQVLGTSSINPNPLANVAQGWALTDPKSDAYFRLLAGGGTIHFGTMMEGSEAKRVQALVESGVDDATILNNQGKVKRFYRRYIEPGISAYNELGNRGEAINRASLYDQLRKQKVYSKPGATTDSKDVADAWRAAGATVTEAPKFTHAEASLQARDLMDFSMQGSFTTIRFLTQVVPFLNARLQGLYKLGRGAKEDPARFSAVVGAAAVMSVALLAAYGDDDEWKKREEWDRNNFWWFKFGGTAFRIPKPFEIGAIATLAERGFELAFDEEMTSTRFRKQVMTLLGDNLSMNPVPQLVKPILDIYANKDSFSGRPIETMSMERLKAEYRFNDRTSMTARAASTGLNAVTGLVGAESLSPVQIDHMLRGYFGWLGSFVVGAGDVIARPLTDQPKHATPDYWKVATGGIVSGLRDAPSRYVSQMYDQAQAIEKAYGTWRQLRKEGKAEEAQEFAEDNRDKIAKYQLIQRAKRNAAKLNERVRMIERSNMDADQKRDLITTIRQQQNAQAKALAL